MTRTAVLSDIHGNLSALEAVIADAEQRGCIEFVNLGDILSGPLWPSETANLLMPLNWPTIAGNHERQVLTDPDDRIGLSDKFTRSACSSYQLAWLAALPSELAIGNFLCTHARPGNDHEYLLESVDPEGLRDATDQEVKERLKGVDHELVLHGHSHLPKVRRLSDGRVLANPGSVGLPAYDDNRPFEHVVETGSPKARYLILDKGEIELLSVDYDFECAARRAESNGANDWAGFLRTGKAR
ncbi:metallophosphoesterase family protein [uncultured Erythrobacter sp.]|uniref:metallophosphoesterase family protein n=1 Tax=uncultured Erythrobacter sp. TaxID=263913 RepID=UPI00261A01A5|nr:metallophosphoesterase family protein [uncultured Erythrobacter sp.]